MNFLYTIHIERVQVNSYIILLHYVTIQVQRNTIRLDTPPGYYSIASLPRGSNNVYLFDFTVIYSHLEYTFGSTLVPIFVNLIRP